MFPFFIYIAFFLLAYSKIPCKLDIWADYSVYKVVIGETPCFDGASTYGESLLLNCKCDPGDDLAIQLYNDQGWYFILVEIFWNFTQTENITYTGDHIWLWREENMPAKEYRGNDCLTTTTKCLGGNRSIDATHNFYFTFPYYFYCVNSTVTTISYKDGIILNMNEYIQPEISFNKYKNELQFSIKSNYGTLTKDTTILDSNSFYSFDIIKYTPTKYGVLDHISYFGKTNTNKTKICFIDIYTCHPNCRTCEYSTQTVSDNNMLCTSCIQKHTFFPTHGNCRPDAPEGKYYDKNEILQDCYESCKACSTGGTNDIHNCESCKTNFFPKEEGPSSNCYDNLDGYFLDRNIFRPCQSECKSCNGEGTPQEKLCITCIEGFKLEKNTTNCYRICPDYFYFDTTLYQKICWEKCNKAYPHIINTSKQCVDNCSDYSLLFEDEYCVESCSIKRILLNDTCLLPEEIPNYLHINHDEMKNILKNNASAVLTYSQIGKQINGIDFTMELYLLDNNSFAPGQNLSKIDLGECEIILRKTNNIPESEPLYIAKLDVFNESSVTNKVDYLVFDPNRKQLDLEVCKYINISVENYIKTDRSKAIFDFASLMANGGIDIFNSDDEFFNNLCVSYSQNGTDLTLSSRRKDIYQNISFCDDGCEYQGINYITMRAQCSCEPLIEDNAINKETISKLFTRNIPLSNLIILKCYKLFIIFDYWRFNIGFWFVSATIVIQIGTLITFLGYGREKMFSKIYAIIKSSPPKRYPLVKKHAETSMFPFSKSPGFELIDSLNNPINTYNKQDKRILVRSKKFAKKKDLKKGKNQPYNIDNKYSDMSSSINNFVSRKQKKIIIFLNNKKTKKVKKKDNKLPKSLQHTKPRRNLLKREILFRKSEFFTLRRLENMPYFQAKTEDKRKFLSMYWDTLKLKQSIVKICSPETEYDLIELKLCGFLFTVTLNFTLNAAFYTDNIINERYENGGSLSFWSEYLRSIYSCLLGVIISSIVLSNSSYSFLLELVKNEFFKSNNFKMLVDRILKKVKKKIMLFFIFDFLFMLFFLYYDTLFCCVYKSSQWSWFQGGISSFLISLVVSIILSLVLSSIRNIGLVYRSKKVYNLSLFLNKFV